MRSKNVNRNSLQYIKRARIIILAVYAAIVLFTLLFFSRFAVEKSGDILKNKVVSLTSSLCAQMKLNMESFCVTNGEYSYFYLLEKNLHIHMMLQIRKTTNTNP